MPTAWSAQAACSRDDPDPKLAPASKSITNRALLCAALAEGTSHLHGAAGSDDAHAMATALSQLGAGIDLG
ncbi:MAG TPA: 3-phosphoshikimate 1-carboxyvinyltransferase, partial [Actinomycetota bacterium]|nr:3-phosphoshikimate 1-carboxyvinyltransferase [Actinomycetota bacterium]